MRQHLVKQTKRKGSVQQLRQVLGDREGESEVLDLAEALRAALHRQPMLVLVGRVEEGNQLSEREVALVEV